jgi:hypothetical protein
MQSITLDDLLKQYGLQENVGAPPAKKLRISTGADFFPDSISPPSSSNVSILHSSNDALTPSNKFICLCGIGFDKFSDLTIHTKTDCLRKAYVCNSCHKGFARNQDLKRHKAMHRK